MTKQEFGEVMDMLAGAYGVKFPKADPEVAKCWCECLNDLQPEWLMPTIVQWIQENRFPPTIAEIRDLYHKKKGVSRWQ